MNKFKKIIKIILINSLILILLLGICGYVFFIQKKRDNTVENTQSMLYHYHEIWKDDFIPNELKFYRLSPNTGAKGKLTKDGKIVKQIKVTIDSNGFRKTPDIYDPNKNPVVFFGCSYAFGYGLEDKETLPWLFSKLTHRKTYNVSFNGFGAQHMLLNLQSEDFKKIIPKADLFVYVFIDDHIARLNGPSYNCGTTYYSTFKLKNNKLVYVEPSALFLKQSYAREFLNSIGCQKKIKTDIYSPKVNELMIKIIQQSQYTIKEKYPNSRFVILAVSDNKKIIKTLKSSGVQVIETSDLYKPEIFRFQEMTIECHPNAAFWKKITPKLIQQLGI